MIVKKIADGYKGEWEYEQNRQRRGKKGKSEESRRKKRKKKITSSKNDHEDEGNDTAKITEETWQKIRAKNIEIKTKLNEGIGN